MKKKVTVFGSFVVDLMGRAPHLPVPGETVKGNFFKQGPGGKGFNQGVAAHKSGADLVMITKLGRDSMAEVALNAMDELEMNKDYLFFSEKYTTGIALILVDENTSENAILIVPGACADITDEDIASVKQTILESSFLLLQLEINQDANEKVAKFAKENNIKVIVNTAPYQPVSDEFLNGVYLVTPNEVEAEGLTGIKVVDESSAEEAAKVFFSKGVQNVIITLGNKGAYINDRKISKIVPAYEVNTVDTTGAGDAFNGGLVAALAEGKSLYDAVLFANAVAALSVQKLGTTPSMPTRAETDEFIANQN